jgi:hypothetical protein
MHQMFRNVEDVYHQHLEEHLVDYAKFRSRSHHAVVRVYDDAGNVIETYEQAGGFKEF